MNMIKLKKRVRIYRYGILVAFILYALLAIVAIFFLAIAANDSIMYMGNIPLLKKGLVSEYTYKMYVFMVLLGVGNGKFFEDSSQYLIDVMKRIANIYVYLRDRTTR